VFFSLSSWTVALIIVALVGGITAVGVVLGRYLRKHSDALREPFGVLQGALLGVVGLILAFGLSLAVGRYEDRRAAVVAEANAIGTTYLRAQLQAGQVDTIGYIDRKELYELIENVVDKCDDVANAIQSITAKHA